MFLDPETRTALIARLDSFEPDTRQNLFDVLTTASFNDGVNIALGAGRSASSTRFFVDDAPHLADVILRSDNFEFLVDDVTEAAVIDLAQNLAGRPISEQRRIADTLISASEPEAVLGLAALDSSSPFVSRVANNLGLQPPHNSIDVAEALAISANSTGSWAPFEQAVVELAQSVQNRLPVVVRNRISGTRFELRRAPAREHNQLYLWTGEVNETTGRRVYVIVDAYEPGVGIFSLKNFQLADTPRNQILNAINEANQKYRADNFEIADVPSRPGALPADEPLRGQLHVEFPIQERAWTGAIRDEACNRAAGFVPPVFLVDANGRDLCAGI